MKRHVAIVGLLVWLLIACNPASPTAPAPSPTVKPIPSPTPTTPSPTPVLSDVLSPPKDKVEELAPLPPLPTLVPRPTVAPTPFPDEQAIVETVLGTGASEHNAANLVSGSFTAPGADEHLALVSGIGDYDELRWVVVGQTDDGWQLRGVSDVLGLGFDAPPSYYAPPDMLDFDGDGRQEVLSPYFKMQWGWISSSDTLYRWDGQSLARVWGETTTLDNRMADNRDVPQQHRQNYRAAWEWADLDGDAPDEILLHEETAFYLPGDEGYIPDDAPSTNEENGERAFRWNGEAFRPYAPDGPAGDFAYIAGDTLWLWQNHTARPLGMKGVREFLWSPDGRRIAWWGETSIESTFRIILGVYDLPAGDRWEFPVDGAPSTLRWSPAGRPSTSSGHRLAYAVLPNYPHALLDPETGQQEPLPIGFSDTWSPTGEEMAYERSGGVYVYAPTTGRERLLVRSPEGAGRDKPRPSDPVWSPRGDWIACSLETITDTWVGLVYPGAPEPVGASDLLDTFSGREAPALQFAWSPDGAHLAVLTSDPRFAQQPTTLYLAKVPAGGDDPVGLPEWREALQLEAVTQTVRLAWSPDGERVTVAVGNEVWEVTTAGETTLRHRFSFPDSQWETLEWAPDGSGFLAGLTEVYDAHLYWFPAGDAEPVLLLVGSAAANWAPRTVEAQASPESRPPMVLVEHTDDVPLLHFVDEDGADISVSAEGYGGLGFQVAGDRVYYGGYYANRSGVVSLDIPDVLDVCDPPLVSPDDSQLAWLCDDVDGSALMSGLTPEFHFVLVLTDAEGDHPREVWNHVESGPGYRLPHLVSWRADGEVIYLAQREYMMGWGYFDYNPAMLALDVSTGQATQIGDDAFDAAVSPDGAWLVQSFCTSPDKTSSAALRSLVNDVEQVIPVTEGAFEIGDFSFSPGNTWLAWQEHVMNPGRFRLRAMRLPGGEPFTVYEVDEYAVREHRIAGWLGPDELVVVRKEATPRGSSYLITLPSIGSGDLLSPLAFLGVLGEAQSPEMSDMK
ncbi:MAG: hypothetical protein U9R05_09785 [Chloroflexota bacterium]|nr:hypothetical protein [Chloroflexota bacterium]